VTSTRICLTQGQLQNLKDLHPTLVKILDDLIDAWPGKNMIITSIYRTREEDKALGGSGVHATIPHRAIDIRVRNLSGDFQAKGEEVANVINAFWVYDPERPTKNVAIAKVHGSGPHVHVQVHPRTQRSLVN